MSVAIVGAGIAGLRVARRLHDAGVDVQLFDKARGAGGRLSTRRTEDGPFDHGAQYLTARDARFREVVAGWLEDGVVARWDPRCVYVDADGQVSEAISAERYVGLPGMSGIARALRGSLPIELGVRIRALRDDGAAWTLVSEDDRRFGPFERVVVAVPAPQAVPLLDAVPGFARVAEAARLLPCHAVLPCFAEPVDVAFDAVFVEGRALGWAARNASKPDRAGGECWVLHSTAAWSEANLEAPGDDVGATLIAAFREVVGDRLPAIRTVTTHRWRYARASGAAPGVQWDAEQGIGVCGDWLVGDRVEDAFLSGDRLADAMLEGAGAR